MIDFVNVSKIYDGDVVGIEDVNIHINKGDFLFLVGPTGSGKSTFIKLILREMYADKGQIIVHGKDIATLSNREIPQYRQQIGTVFQDFGLLPNKTVFENIAFAMGIADKADKFPRELSGGQKQRVAIARAIANDPEILIADEPTGSLDPETSREIMQLLDGINHKGTTVIVVTHNEGIVNEMHKRVVAINGGHIVKDKEKGEYGYDG